MDLMGLHVSVLMKHFDSCLDQCQRSYTIINILNLLEASSKTSRLNVGLTISVHPNFAGDKLKRAATCPKEELGSGEIMNAREAKRAST